MPKDDFYNLVKTAEKFAPGTPEQASAAEQVKFGLGTMNRSKSDDARLGPPPAEFKHQPAQPVPN